MDKIHKRFYRVYCKTNEVEHRVRSLVEAKKLIIGMGDWSLSLLVIDETTKKIDCIAYLWKGAYEINENYEWKYLDEKCPLDMLALALKKTRVA